jgi:hypothetical protein
MMRRVLLFIIGGFLGLIFGNVLAVIYFWMSNNLVMGIDEYERRRFELTLIHYSIVGVTIVVAGVVTVILVTKRDGANALRKQ